MKERADSLRGRLSPDLRVQVDEWLFSEQAAYGVVRERLAAAGVKTGISALARYYEKRMEERLYEQIVVQSAKAANKLVTEVERNPAQVQPVLMELVSRIALQEAMRGNNLDVDRLMGLVRMMTDGQKLELQRNRLGIDREKLELLKQKAAQADAAKAVAQGTLTAEEKMGRFREIFGISKDEG
jgi:hypothetical protein